MDKHGNSLHSNSSFSENDKEEKKVTNSKRPNTTKSSKKVAGKSKQVVDPDAELTKFDAKIKRTRSIQSSKAKTVSRQDAMRRTRNCDKPHNNFSKISRWLQLNVLMFLNEKEVVKTGRVCHTLYMASNDEFLWKQKFIIMRGEKEFSKLFRQYQTVHDFTERALVGNEYKRKCLRQMNAGKNMTSRKFKPLTIKLSGHTNRVIALS